jgi:hypothetical protein
VIPLQRPPLPVELRARLGAQRERLAARERVDVPAAREAWRGARTVRRDIGELLVLMAAGHARCMYCCDSRGTSVDHFEPIMLAPLRAFDWSNHLLACSYCNSNQKRELFPRDEITRECLLVDPTVDPPDRHLRLRLGDGVYRGLTEKGRRTIEVFGLNSRRDLVLGRLDAVAQCQGMLRDSVRQAGTGNRDGARRMLAALSRRPNGDVLYAMLSRRNLPDAARLLGGDDVVAALHQLAAVIDRARLV